MTLTVPKAERIGFAEFVALMASLIAMVALSIDAMLPALDVIGKELNAADDNQPQLVITMFFLGFAFAQLLYGPLSDSFGRKPSIYIGLGLYLVGTALCLIAPSLPALIAGRILQGIGAAGPRIVANAIIRDRYEGRRMASVSSLIMMVFILVPMMAPLVGQAIMTLSDWRGIFWFFAALATGTFLWTLTRLDETLSPEKRRPFRAAPILGAVCEVLTNRLAIGCTLAMGLTFSAFLSFLSSSQQVLGEAYGLGEYFPITFTGLAAVNGLVLAANSQLVLRHGMQRLATIGVVTMTVASAFYCTVHWVFGEPPLWVALIWLAAMMGSIGVIFSNLTAMAMEPLGHIAGIASAVIGSISSLMATVGGTLMADRYDGTALPLALSYSGCGFAALIVLRWATRDRTRRVR